MGKVGTHILYTLPLHFRHQRMNGTGLRQYSSQGGLVYDGICLFEAGLENLAHWTPLPLGFMILFTKITTGNNWPMRFVKMYRRTKFHLFLQRSCFPNAKWAYPLIKFPGRPQTIYTYKVWDWHFLRISCFLWWTSRWRVWFGFPMLTTILYTIHAFLTITLCYLLESVDPRIAS